MDLTTIRQTSKGQYGLDRSATADALFTDPVLNDLVNAAHMDFAAVSRCYYATLPTLTTVIGQTAYALDASLIELDIYTVRINLTPYTRLTMKALKELIQQNGPPETWVNAAPSNFFMHPGSTAGNAKVIELYPPPNGTVSLKYNGYVYPVVLSADGDTPVLAASEHYRIIPWVCWKMACLEASRGRQDAPTELWYQIAFNDALELREIFRRGMEEPQRTANVGASALEDAMTRRYSPARKIGEGQVK